MSTSNFKDEARRLVDQLPADATWEDLQYETYVRQAIESGLRDADAGRTLSSSEVRARLGLNQL